jgi:hypothetical protein
MRRVVVLAGSVATSLSGQPGDRSHGAHFRVCKAGCCSASKIEDDWWCATAYPIPRLKRCPRAAATGVASFSKESAASQFFSTISAGSQLSDSATLTWTFKNIIIIR